jgi:hypothetical protein
MVPVLRVDAEVVRVGDPLAGAHNMRKADFLGKWRKRGIYLRRRPIPQTAP